MSRIIVIEFVSLDGVIHDPDGAEGSTHGGWAFRHGPQAVAGDKFRLGELLDTGALLLGYAWVALIVHPGMGYAELGAAFTVAGVGTSFCFPTVANAVMGSAPPELAGVASGANSALRELGGVFGVAILAAVFAHPGAYGSPAVFVDGFTQALWVGAGLSALGIVAALLGSMRRRPAPAPLTSGLALAAEPE